MSVTYTIPKPRPAGLYVEFQVPAAVAVGDLLLLPSGLKVEITSLRLGRQATERLAKVKGVGQDLPPIGVLFALMGATDAPA